MKFHFDSALDATGIDTKNGIIRGAVACTAGVQAKGHSLVTDRLLLQQLFESALDKGGKLPVHLDHRSGAAGCIGTAQAFRLSDNGTKLRCDVHLFKTHDKFSQVMELLENLHETAGLSASFTGEGENGVARCKDFLSADLVIFPAANPTGLFSARDGEEDETDERIDHMDNDDHITDQDIADLLHQALETMERLEEENSQLRDLLEQLVDEENGEDETDGADTPGEDESPVLDERGARRGPYQYATQLPMHDFASRVEAFQLEGKSQKEAHILALKQLARETYQAG